MRVPHVDRHFVLDTRSGRIAALAGTARKFAVPIQRVHKSKSEPSLAQHSDQSQEESQPLTIN